MTDNIEGTKSETEDQELNDLLDSALQDFDKMSVLPKKNSDTLDTQKQMDKSQTVGIAENSWTEDFIKQTAEQFEKNLQNLLQSGGDSEVGATLQKLGQASTNNATAGEDAADFQSAISQVLKDLSVASEHLQNEADLTSLLGQTSLDGDTGDILPFMQGMLQQLISKEILYPPLKEVSDKYPAWLEEHKATLNASDLQRYTKQWELMRKMCSELEKEKETDTEEVKKLRCESILKLMNEMQTYGQAPEDLVGEQSALFQFDSEGTPILPLPSGEESQKDCCIM